MQHRFDADTAVRPSGPGRFEGTVSREWWVFEGPNGGYLAALILNGLAAAVADPVRTPRSLTIHFTQRPTEGAAELRTTIERTGRSMTTVGGRLVQGDDTVAVTLAAFSADRSGYAYDSTRMPEVPPPAACPPRPVPTSGFVPPLTRHLEMRWALGPAPFSGGHGHEATVGTWIRLAPLRPADPAALALFLDAVTPALFATTADPMEIGGLPTVDLTVHFRAPLPPDPDPAAWYLAVFTTRLARGGFVDEDGEIWTEDGVLLAHSRQLMVVR